MKKYVLLLLITIISLSLSYVVLPFEKKNYIKDGDSYEMIASKLTNSLLKVDFSIGTPLQKLDLILSTDKYYSFAIEKNAVIDIEFVEGPKYDSKNSTTRKEIEGIFIEGTMEGNAIYETVNFANMEFQNYSFVEINNIHYGQKLYGGSGILGIGPYESIENDISYEKNSIVKQLKEYNKTNNYFVSIHYENDNKGIIAIGAKLEECVSKFSGMIEVNTSFPSLGTSLNLGFSIDNITYEDEEAYIKATVAKFSLDSNYILVNKKMKSILDREIFEVLLKDKRCVEIAKKNADPTNEYIKLYHCEKDSIDRNKLFTIKLYSKELNYTFEINLRDLVVDYNNRTYFLVAFDNRKTVSEELLVLGEPFLKKYSFHYNKDKTKVGFYHQSKEPAKPGKNWTKIIVIIIVAFVVVIIILVLIIYKLWYKRPRKLRGVELDDNNYEYIPS